MTQITELENQLHLIKQMVWELEAKLNKFKVSAQKEVPIERERGKENDDIFHRITWILRDVGIPANIKGYRFTREAIQMVYEDGELLGQVTKTLYPAIAKKFNTTACRVERAIRHAISSSWEVASERNGTIFGIQLSELKRPTNSEFFAFVVDNLRIGQRS